MSSLSLTRIPQTSLVNLISIFYKKITISMSKARKFRETVSELNKLPPRLLEDIGISESDITSVVYYHIYEKSED